MISLLKVTLLYERFDRAGRLRLELFGQMGAKPFKLDLYHIGDRCIRQAVNEHVPLIHHPIMSPVVRFGLEAVFSKYLSSMTEQVSPLDGDIDFSEEVKMLAGVCERF